jgi:hypothetical protein
VTVGRDFLPHRRPSRPFVIYTEVGMVKWSRVDDRATARLKSQTRILAVGRNAWSNVVRWKRAVGGSGLTNPLARNQMGKFGSLLS